MTASVLFTWLVSSCSQGEDNSLGPYYEFTFRDNISAVAIGDSIHVLVFQVPVTSSYLQTIPFEMTESVSLLDTIKLTLTVLYGGYSFTPNPVRDVEVRGDSVIVKYDRAVSYGGFKKSDANNRVETSPRPTYYSIQNAEILAFPNRNITFESELIH